MLGAGIGRYVAGLAGQRCTAFFEEGGYARRAGGRVTDRLRKEPRFGIQPCRDALFQSRDRRLQDAPGDMVTPTGCQLCQGGSDLRILLDIAGDPKGLFPLLQQLSLAIEYVLDVAVTVEMLPQPQHGPV